MADDGDDDDDDDDDKPPHLKVVSDNPNARADRQVAEAKDEVERTVALFAAAILRTMMEATYLMHRLSDFLDAISKYRAETGHGLSVADLEMSLRLPLVGYVSSKDEWRHRRWIREDGLGTIVRGALRLRARLHPMMDLRVGTVSVRGAGLLLARI
jgi:hypothetical protein